MASINMPKGRNLANELSQTLSAQLGILPNMLAAQSDFAPLQASNQLSNLQTLLLGTEGGSYDTREFSPAVYQQKGGYHYGALPKGLGGLINYPDLPDATGGGGGGGGGLGGLKLPSGPADALGRVLNPVGTLKGLLGGKNKGPGKLITPSGWKTVTHTLGPQRGLLDIYQKDIAPALRNETSATRASDVADLAKLGPGALEALKAANPSMAGLIDTLANTAQQDLGLGTALEPGAQRLLEQSTRGAQAARGLGFGPSDALQESLGLTRLGEDLKQRRMGTAASVAGLENQVYQVPLLQMLTRQGNLAGIQSTAAQAGGLGQMGSLLGFLNPENSYASDLYNTNFNALVNQAVGNASNQNALIGAGIQTLGGLGGAALGGMI